MKKKIFNADKFMIGVFAICIQINCLFQSIESNSIPSIIFVSIIIGASTIMTIWMSFFKKYDTEKSNNTTP